MLRMWKITNNTKHTFYVRYFVLSNIVGHSFHDNCLFVEKNEKECSKCSYE
jgi:hypothetical protein